MLFWRKHINHQSLPLLPKHSNLLARIAHIGSLHLLRQFGFAERIVGGEHLNFIPFLFGVVPCVYFLLNAANGATSVNAVGKHDAKSNRRYGISEYILQRVGNFFVDKQSAISRM